MVSRRKIQRDLKTGAYYVQIRRNGVRQYFWLGKVLKYAERELKRIEKDIAANRIEFSRQELSVKQPDGQKDISVIVLVIKYLEWVKEHRAVNTYKLRWRYAFQFLIYLGLGHTEKDRFVPTGDMMISEIKRSTLTEYHTWARNRIGGNNPNSGNHALREVKTILLWGVEEELCDLQFRKFPQIHESPPKTKRIELSDLTKLFEVAPRDVCDFMILGLLTGLRPKEQRELTVDQVFKMGDKWYIRIDKHKTAGRTREVRDRTVPLSELAKEIIGRQMEGHPTSKYIFVNNDGTPYNKDSLRKRIVRWCKKAGIPEITPYALRHTFASIESDSQVETVALSRLMGHSSIKTLTRYISNSSDHDFAAVNQAELTVKRALGMPKRDSNGAEL